MQNKAAGHHYPAEQGCRLMLLASSKVIENREAKSAGMREVLARVGDKWSLQVMDYLCTQPQRFNEIRRGIEGISQRMLTLTLRSLERDGLVLRKVHSTKPYQVEYELTVLGRDLLYTASILTRWADTHWQEICAARARFDGATESRSLAGHYRNGKLQ
jgi:DNA-binding HxlR family transcriptional regulator